MVAGLKMDIDPKCCWRAWDHEDREFYYFDTPEEMYHTMHSFFGDEWSFYVMQAIDDQKEEFNMVENAYRIKTVVDKASEYASEPNITKEELMHRIGSIVYAGWLLGKNKYRMDAILDLLEDRPDSFVELVVEKNSEKIVKKTSHLTLIVNNVTPIKD